MVKNRVIFTLLIAALMILGIFSLNSFSKDEPRSEREQNIAISEKIDEILKGQKEILSRLDELKAQLDIVRIRASHS